MYKMHGENSLKLAWQEAHPRGPSTSAHPASRDSRGAQDDKSEVISSKRNDLATMEIETDPLPTTL